MMWKWIAHYDGLDIAMALLDGKVIGASISLDVPGLKIVVTHFTAVDKRYRGLGVGVGLRDAQLRVHDFDRCVMSLSSVTKINGISAAEWQHETLTRMGYTKVVGSRFVAHMFEYLESRFAHLKLGCRLPALSSSVLCGPLKSLVRRYFFTPSFLILEPWPTMTIGMKGSESKKS